MGNHDAGRAMVATACALADQQEKTGQTALEILDIACADFRGCDAEFDDATWEGPFHELLQEAFGPYDKSTDEDGEVFYTKLIEPFSERYGLT